MSKELTKVQKFNLEMVYKPMIEPYYKNPNYKDMKDEEIIDSMVKFLYFYFSQDKLDKIFEFLDLYKELINDCSWRMLFNGARRHHNNKYSQETIIKIAERYDTFLGRETWNELSQIVKKDDDFVKKYKDKLNWVRLSKGYIFSEEFLLEMKDYVSLAHYFKNNHNHNKSIKHKLVTYLQNHLEEAFCD